MIPALFIANRVIEYSNYKGYPINNLRLQKLLYFINARSLVETGRPIFDESMQKWKYGPVVSDVYHEYKRYGAFGIEESDLVDVVIHFDTNQNPFDDATQLTILRYETFDFDEETSRRIETTVDKLSNYSTFDLVDETHRHDIWKKDEARIESGEKGIDYANEEILTFFKENEEVQIWR